MRRSQSKIKDIRGGQKPQRFSTKKKNIDIGGGQKPDMSDLAAETAE